MTAIVNGSLSVLYKRYNIREGSICCRLSKSLQKKLISMPWDPNISSQRNIYQGYNLGHGESAHHQMTRRRLYSTSSTAKAPYTHLKMKMLNPKMKVWKMIFPFQTGDFQLPSSFSKVRTHNSIIECFNPKIAKPAENVWICRRTRCQTWAQIPGYEILKDLPERHWTEQLPPSGERKCQNDPEWH